MKVGLLNETPFTRGKETWALLACGVIHSRRPSAHVSNKILHCPTSLYKRKEVSTLYKLSSLQHIVAGNTLREDTEVEAIASILNTENTFLSEERI